jgi:hypothetical protein
MPDDDRPLRACCLISEVLEEAGLDRERARALRRQLLQGVILLCQWQLERMNESAQRPAGAKARARPAAGPRRPRRVAVD